MTLLLIALGFALAYFVLQLQYMFFWSKLPAVTSPQSVLTNVSILVVARNESSNIEHCLRGLISQHYPSHLFEIIVIDDHSTDDTLRAIRQIRDSRIRVLELKNFPQYIHGDATKKSGITLGVDHALHDLIVVTDADCVHPQSWLRTIVHSFDTSGCVFQAAPVLLLPGKNKTEQMQETEMLALMLITGSGIQSGVHDMANGANMAFTKKAFQDVHGYEGNFQFASGDDMFLIEKMRNSFAGNISFAKSKEAVVLTSAQSNWASLLRQRVRWAGKNMGLKKKTIPAIWFFVGMYHSLLLSLCITSVFHFTLWYPFLMMLSLKWIADFFLLQQAAIFFKKENLLRHFVVLQMMYGWYVLRMGWVMMLGARDDWKK